ncbi:MAG: hypothetical protein QUS14_13610 [Pyrinomonadaceae bacterium]|nr:hypothetical protein [Pyrinomonadaceae bacterium]
MIRIDSLFSVRRALSFTVLAVSFLFATATSQAQIRPYGASYNGGISVPVSTSVWQSIRVMIAVPDSAGSRASGGANVRVFDGRTELLYETSVSALPGGFIHTFEIDPFELPITPDPVTGRVDLRIKVDLFLRSAVFDSDQIEFPTSFELVDNQTSKAILIGLLLPAVQKVR